MPRSGPGPATGLSWTRTVPAVAVSKPAIMRSRVGLPQPEAPSRHTNSPVPTTRSMSPRAATRPFPTSKVFDSPSMRSRGALSAREIVASDMMLRAPAQQAVVHQHDDAVRKKAGNPDHDHAADDEIRARQGPPVHDDGAEPLGDTGHFADDDQDPGESEAEPEAVEDARRRRRQDHGAEQLGAAAAEHGRRLEQAHVYRL